MLIDKMIDSIKNMGLKINTILDIGTRDLAQSLEMRSVYPNADIYAIEANKESFDCIVDNEHNIKVFNFAALNYDGETSFFAVKQDQNRGASSVFEPTDKLEGVTRDGFSKVVTAAKRIDTWAKENRISSIDMVWMDVQGSEIKTLEGFGTLLDKVKVVATEAETGELYYSSRDSKPTQYEELKKFLETNEFSEVSYDQAWELECDVVYVKNEYLRV